MIQLTILFGLYILASLAVIALTVRWAHQERKELEDRLMAISSPEALITNRAVNDPEPGDVRYVDEQREWELSAGGS